MADATQYAIDIAAAMPAGDKTLAQLDALTAQLSGGGARAEHFDRALVKVADALDGASAASREAATALAAANTENEQLEKTASSYALAADKVAASQEKLAQKAARSQAAVDRYAKTLAKLEAASEGTGATLEEERAHFARLQGAATSAAKAVVNAAEKETKLRSAAAAAKAALADQAVGLERLEKEAEQAAAAQDRLAKTQRNLRTLQGHVNSRLGDATTKLSTFRGALGDVGGPLGELGERALFPAQAFVDLNEKFGRTAAIATVSVVGLAAVAAALLAVGAAAGYATVKILAWSVALSDSARSADVARDAFEALHPGVRELREQITDLSDATGVAEADLRGFALQLQGAKVSAAELPDALEAVALAEGALDGGGSEFVKRMGEGKKSVSALAQEARSKFGGVVARRMRSLDKQSVQFRKNVGEIFGDLNIEPVLSGMQTLVSLLDQNTESGEAVKAIFSGIFQPIVDQAQAAAFAVEAFALGFLIGLLKLYIQLKPIIGAVSELFGFEDTSLEDTLFGAKSAGELFAYAAVAVIAVLGIVAGLFALLTVAVFGTSAAIFAGAAAFVYFGSIVLSAILGAVSSAIDYFQNTSWEQIGTDIITGIVEGITGANSLIIAAITGVVGGAITAAKSLLGIASPSKVFADIGEDTGAGFVAGVESENDNAEAAVEELATPPLVRISRGTSGSSDDAVQQQAPQPPDGRDRGGRSVDFSGATFVFNGVEGAEDSEARFEELSLRALEGDAAQLGSESAA